MASLMKISSCITLHITGKRVAQIAKLSPADVKRLSILLAFRVGPRSAKTSRGNSSDRGNFRPMLQNDNSGRDAAELITPDPVDEPHHQVSNSQSKSLFRRDVF